MPEHAEPGPGQAMELAEAHHPPPKPGGILNPQPGLMVWTIITFVLLLLILRKLAWGPMLAMLDKREKAIAEALARSEQARAEAERILADQKTILDQARREAQELIERSRQDGERARQGMLGEAREQSEKIIAAGKQAIEQEKKSALQEIRTVAVDLALGAAARLIEVNADDRVQRGKVEQFVQELEQRAS